MLEQNSSIFNRYFINYLYESKNFIFALLTSFPNSPTTKHTQKYFSYLKKKNTIKSLNNFIFVVRVLLLYHYSRTYIIPYSYSYEILYVFVKGKQEIQRRQNKIKGIIEYIQRVNLTLFSRPFKNQNLYKLYLNLFFPSVWWWVKSSAFPMFNGLILYMYIKCISDTYTKIYVYAYYNEQGKSTRLREEKTRYFRVFVRYIIIDCATNESIGRNVPGLDLWLRCRKYGLGVYLFYFYGSLKKTSIYNIAPRLWFIIQNKIWKLNWKQKNCCNINVSSFFQYIGHDKYLL